MTRNKKGEIISLIVILSIVFILFLIIFNIKYNRECSKDSECGEDHYCGADFACHQHPVIEKVLYKNDFVIPSIIIGISLIIAAIIFRRYPYLHFNKDSTHNDKVKEKYHEVKKHKRENKKQRIP